MTANSSGLTERQRTIVTMATHGSTIEQIARTQAWSERTIKSELTSMCERLSARNTTHLVYIATKAGMIT